MKRLILLIVTLAAAATRLFAAHLCPSTGRVVDEQGKACLLYTSDAADE